jgi:hypothetical protein
MTTNPDLDKLNDCIDRLADTDRDRQLDGDIMAALGHTIKHSQARYTMDYLPVVTYEHGPYKGMTEPCPELTVNVQAVLILCNHLLPRWRFILEGGDAKHQSVKVTLFLAGENEERTKLTIGEHAHNLAAAFTQAVLKAVRDHQSPLLLG